MINDLLKEKNISIYRLAKDSGVPYATLNDICNKKTRLEKCSAETIYKISKVLGVSMETLLEPYLEERCSFELYKSNVCHRVKLLGDIEFVIEVLESDSIRRYYKRKWYPECFYLLAMLDYLSRENNIPICTEYNDLRCRKLEKPIYPASILVADAALKNKKIKEQAFRDAIPEFKQFNIVENEVRNVV